MKINKNILLIGLLVISIIVFNSFVKEGFQTINTNTGLGSWPKDLINRFLVYQKTVNENNNQFDMNILQKQASVSEAENYLKTGYWNWSDDLMKEYLIEVGNNPIIKLDPGISLNYAMRLYNQNAIKDILAWNTKEGKFLLYGVDLGITSGPKYNWASNPHNTIKCVTDSNGNSVIEKTIYKGIDRHNGYLNEEKTRLSNESLTNEIPGFSFINGPCNPCAALDTHDFKQCQFSLH
jgi:hypothetical protein